MKPRFLIAALALATASSFAQAADTYVIDGNHTQVRFEYSHFGFSNIVGLFTGMSGELVYDAADVGKSSVKVNLPIQQVFTGVADLDDHLRSADFFDAAKFPEATFSSTRVEAAGEGKLKVSGELKLRDVSVPVVLDVRLNAEKTHPMSGRPAIGFDATTTLKRTALGVGKYAPNVSDEVKIAITLEANAPKS